MAATSCLIIEAGGKESFVEEVDSGSMFEQSSSPEGVVSRTSSRGDGGLTSDVRPVAPASASRSSDVLGDGDGALLFPPDPSASRRSALMSVSTRAAAEWIAVRARDTSDCDAGADEEEGAAARAGAGGGSCCMVGPTWQ
uniref:Uncharacterized protein n=1 Tax=Arundo donax TaxID=35708 RepID=A0A0A9GRS8_ARUDO